MFNIFSYICLFVAANFYNKNTGLRHSTCWERDELINPFVPYAPFLYTLKTSENRKVFWCFQRVEKEYIKNKWVNHSKYKIRSGRKKSLVFYNKSCSQKYSQKNTWVRVFLIKKFKATLLQRDSNKGVFLWILQNF